MHSVFRFVNYTITSIMLCDGMDANIFNFDCCSVKLLTIILVAKFYSLDIESQVNISAMFVCVFVFQLKPYVSYRVSDVTQPEFTARDLFDSTYAKLITDDFNNGRLEPDKVLEMIKMVKSSGSK